MKQVGVMALIGLSVGLVAALALGAVAAVLFGLAGRDPAVMRVAAVMLTAVILAASWLPAWRASRIAPIAALRYERAAAQSRGLREPASSPTPPQLR